MKMLSSVIVAVIILCGLFAVLKWIYPEALTFIVSPLVSDGPSLFQIFQAIALSGAALATLWLTNRRTEAINRQAENAQHQAQAALKQIELNQNQLLASKENKLRESFEISLQLLSGDNSTQMSKLAAFNMFEEIVEQDAERYYQRVKSMLESYIALETSTLTLAFDRNQVNSTNAALRAADRTKYEVFSATTTLRDLQKKTSDALIKRVLLSNIFLSKLNLYGFDLRRSLLTNTYFNKITFTGSNFSRARIEGAFFVDCKFLECDFSDAIFNGDFDGCKMIGCRVDGCTLPAGKGWTFQHNKHAEDSPPKLYPDIWPLYQNSIDEERKRIEEEIAETPSPEDLSPETAEEHRAILHQSLYAKVDFAVPAFIVDGEETEPCEDEEVP